MFRDRKVIVIAPCLDEEVKIKEVLRRVKEMPQYEGQILVDEMLVVDDGSTDASATVAREAGATVISMGKVVGVGAALRAGFDYARGKGFDLIVVMAGNNKDEPNEIPDLLLPIVDEGCSFVQGARFLKKSNMGHMPFYRKLATRLHPILFSLVVGKWVRESTNGFRAFTKELLHDDRIRLHQDWLDEYELEPYLYYKAIVLGYKTSEVPCTKIYPPKKIGYTKMKPITGWWSILRPLFLLKLGIKN